MIGARLAAARVLVELESHGGHADRLLGRLDMDPAERRLAWALVLGVERRRLWLDHQLSPHLGRRPAELDPPVRATLRCAAFQILLMDRIPTRAAVHEAVDGIGALRMGKASGLVNASLRSLAREPGRAGAPDEPHVEFSMPRWIVRRLSRPAAGAFNAEPALALRPRVPDLEGRLRKADIEPLDVIPPVQQTCAVLIRAGDPTALPGWRRGEFAVQDAAAQAVVQLVDAQPGEVVADVCAAPGGKALALADAVGPGGRIVALDISPERLARMDSEAARLAIEWVEPHVADITEGTDGSFDRVLVDAPCSALGTLRRHPEVRWQRREADLAQYAERQLGILEAASAAVRPGGRLVYSVCSFAAEEGEGVIERFTARNPGFALAPIGEHWGPARALDGTFRSLPDQGPWDAFYAAVLRRA